MILLDTCTFIWVVSQQEKISKKALEYIAKNAGSIYLSAISIFEIGVKLRKKLLKLPKKPDLWVTQALSLHGITELPITSKIALTATQLPIIHKDPADRIIIATALNHQLTILTPDLHIHQYPDISFIW